MDLLQDYPVVRNRLVAAEWMVETLSLTGSWRGRAFAS